jgi:hypothetical protein
MRRLEERQVPLTVGCPREPSPRLVLDEGCHVLFTDRESKHRVQCVGGLMCDFCGKMHTAVVDMHMGARTHATR